MIGYVSILSAFLVVSYVAAQKLNKLLSSLVVALFSLVSLMLIIQINFIRNDFTELNRYLSRLKDIDPDSLIWFGTNPLWMVEVLTYITNTVLFGGFIGCIGFFLYQRQAKLRDERT